MLKCLRNQMLVWMLFSIMLPCMAAAKEIGKPPAVAAPSWFGKVPTIQQQLEFHTFTQALEESIPPWRDESTLQAAYGH